MWRANLESGPPSPFSYPSTLKAERSLAIVMTSNAQGGVHFARWFAPLSWVPGLRDLVRQTHGRTLALADVIITNQKYNYRYYLL